MWELALYHILKGEIRMTNESKLIDSSTDAKVEILTKLFYEASHYTNPKDYIRKWLQEIVPLDERNLE